MRTNTSRRILSIGAAGLVLLAAGVAFNAWRDRSHRKPASAPALSPLVVSHLSGDVEARPHPLAGPLPERPAGVISGPFDAPASSPAPERAQRLKDAPPTALPSILADLENELREKGGVFAYNSRRYSATMEAGWVDFATNQSLENLGSPQLSYALESIKVGETEIARGGATPGAPRPEQRAVVYRRGAVEEEYVLRAEAMEQTFVVKQ